MDLWARSQRGYGSPWVQGAHHVVAGASFGVCAVGSWIWELPWGLGAAHMKLERIRCISGCVDGRLGGQLRACILVPGSWGVWTPMSRDRPRHGKRLWELMPGLHSR